MSGLRFRVWRLMSTQVTRVVGGPEDLGFFGHTRTNSEWECKGET